MTDKEYFLDFHKLSGDEGERVWQQKQNMHNQPKLNFQVMPDIQGYKSMVDGSWISSRSQHRNHLKQHRMIELGNEIPKKPEVQHDKAGIRRDLINAVKRHSN